jgi:hypothetical protein
LASKSLEAIAYFDECAVQNEPLAASATRRLRVPETSALCSNENARATELRPRPKVFST